MDSKLKDIKHKDTFNKIERLLMDDADNLYELLDYYKEYLYPHSGYVNSLASKWIIRFALLVKHHDKLKPLNK